MTTKFVKLTKAGPAHTEDWTSPIVVNAASIETVRPFEAYPNGKSKARSYVQLKNKDRESFWVAETAEEVFALLRGE